MTVSSIFYSIKSKKIKQLQKTIRQIQNILLEYSEIPMCDVGKTVIELIQKEVSIYELKPKKQKGKRNQR